MTKENLTEPRVIGNRIRELRKWLRISQDAVGTYLEIPRTAVSILENGKREVGSQELLKLSALFRCDPNSILGLSKTAVDYKEQINFKARTNDNKNLDEHDYKELNSFLSFIKDRYRGKLAPKIVDPLSVTKSKVPAKAAQDLKDFAKVDSGPVDIYSIIETLGLYPRFTALNTLAGAIVKAEVDATSSVFGILINSDQPEERTRFSAAHETAHYILSHLTDTEQYHPSIKRNWKDPIESDADSFAAELLMPRETIEKMAGKKTISSPTKVLEFADDLLVSYQAMLFRLLEMQYISKVQMDNYQNEKPTELRKLLNKGKKKKATFDTSILKVLIKQKSESLNSEFVNSPDWIRFIQEAACFEYWKQYSFNERSSEVKDVYEQVALWIAKNQPLQLNKY